MNLATQNRWRQIFQINTKACRNDDDDDGDDDVMMMMVVVIIIIIICNIGLCTGCEE